MASTPLTTTVAATVPVDLGLAREAVRVGKGRVSPALGTLLATVAEQIVRASDARR